MFQEGLPDLTKSLPWWVPPLLGLAVALAGFIPRFRNRWKAGSDAEAQRIRVAVAEALAPVEKQLAHAEKLVSLLEKENEQYQQDLEAGKKREEVLGARIARYLDDEVEMQKKMARVIGQCEEMRQRLDEVERQRDGK